MSGLEAQPTSQTAESIQLSRDVASFTLPEIAVVIPAHNEAENLADLLAEVREALDSFAAYEVIVVDDASSDATAQILRDEMRRFPALRPLRHRRRSGQSAGLITGIRAARAPWIVTLDGDGQNNPADIPALWALRVADAEAGSPPVLVTGHRVGRHDVWQKRFASRIANGVRSALLKDQTPDTGCGLKLFSRQAFLALPHFDHCHRFLPALFLRAGARVITVPVSHRPRMRGRSHYGIGDRLWVGLADLLGVIWLMRRWRDPGGVDAITPP